MIGKNGETLLFCNGGCYKESRERCAFSHGVDIDHVDMEEDHMEERGYVVAHIYCTDMGGHEYFDLAERSEYYNE